MVVRFLFVTYGARTQPQVGVRKTLAFSCVMQRVYLSRHFVSFRNISQNCPMPSSPVNVTSVNVLSILRTSPFQRAYNPTAGWRSAVACKRLRFSVQRTFCHCERKSGTPRDTVYPWGKGAHKHKSEHCRPRQCDFKSAVCAVSSPVNVTFCPSTP